MLPAMPRRLQAASDESPSATSFYAIDGLRDAAVFSVFRRASEAPYYRIEKRPALVGRQGAWSIHAHGGLIVRRGHELTHVLRFFERKRFEVVR